MSKLIKYTVLFIINHFLSGTHAFGFKRWLLNRVHGISVGKGTRVVGPIKVYGTLSVGVDTWIGHDFSVEGNGFVSIGNNCDIAPFVKCLTGSHSIGDHGRRAGKGVTKGITIGNGSWIGANSLILPGIRIEDGVIVAAGALVTKDVDGDCLVGGVPAKTIKVLPVND